MKAVIAILSDDHIGAKIPGVELLDQFPFLERSFHGICPFFSRQHPFHQLFNFIGDTLRVFPEGDFESVGGSIGFPAKFLDIPPVLNLFADVPRHGMVFLCPDRDRRRLSLTNLLNFQPPIACGDVSIRSYKIYRGIGEFLFSGFVHKNGKSAYLLVGKDREAPTFIGHGFKGETPVAILVYGISDLKKVEKELRQQFSDFQLQEATKSDIKKLIHAGTTASSRDNTSVNNTDAKSHSGNRH